MRTHHWRVAAPLTALVLLVGACASDGDVRADDGIEPIESDDPESADDPEPQLEPEPEPQPEPEPEPEAAPPEAASEPEEIDITVVPDEITEEYVEAVLVELERIYAEAYAIVRDEQELTIEITNRVGSIFAESRVDDRYGELQQLSGTPEVFRPQGELSPRVRRVVEVLDFSSDCLWLETLTDSSGLSPAEGEEVVFVALLSKEVERPVDLNPTPWVFERLRVPIEAGSDEGAREDSPCSAR